MLFSSLKEISNNGYTDIPDSFSIKNYSFQYESPIVTVEYIVSESGFSSIIVDVMSENLTIKVEDGDKYRTVVNVKSPVEMTGCYRPCLLYTSPSPRDRTRSRMPSSA